MVRNTDRTKEIDRIVGLKIMERRISLGLSRMQLSSSIEVTPQQLQKYEKGLNRVSAGRLLLIAESLEAPIEFFYNITEEPKIVAGHKTMCIELARNFMKIESETNKIALANLARELAKNE